MSQSSWPELIATGRCWEHQRAASCPLTVVWFGAGTRVWPLVGVCPPQGLTLLPRSAPVFENSSRIVIVMEYASRGDLYDYISGRQRLSEREARHFFRQIVSAVHYCHQVGGPWARGLAFPERSRDLPGPHRERETKARWECWRVWLQVSWLGLEGPMVCCTGEAGLPACLCLSHLLCFLTVQTRS